MKTLVSKRNPQIRITAPEIGSYREFYTLQDKDFHYLFKMEDWTLVEEEPTCKTCRFYENNCPFCCGRFIPYPNKVCKDYIHSAMEEQKPAEGIKGNLEEIPSNVSIEEEPKKQTSKYLKEPDYDKQVVKKNV